MLKKKFFKTIEECEVTFEVNVDDAKDVALVCEHNGWEPIQMKQSKKGPFRTKIRLPKEGQFQFRYLVDGQDWHNDKTADLYQRNEHGSENSVISTVA
jgi:1,4-alpha-glucan branching enzyme